MNNRQKFAYLNEQFILEQKAVVPIQTHALQYGTGCFEGIRAYYNKQAKALFVFRMEDHFKRLFNSCRLLFITPSHSVDELCSITKKLLQKNYEETDIYIRPFAFKADLRVGNFNLHELKDNFAIYTISMGRYLDTTKGIEAGVSSWRRIPDNTIPPRGKITGSYVNTSLAKTEATQNGFGEALLLDFNGHIVEGSAENLFVVQENTLITPPLSEDILRGITRDTVMTIAQKELGLPVVERSIDRSEIYQFDEVFLVGTGAEITPVVKIDGRLIGDGEVGKISQKIKNLYFDIVHGKNKNYQHWVTKITKS